ncbi:fibronectin type III domain-containing protein, partial [Patescibacteria group bacterium]|nr:fibronectin type III domain-containing protein [Patescibacteria group bacterium]
MSIPQITYSASTQLSYGDLVEASIDSAGDSDAYRFEGQAGDTVTIRMAEIDRALGPKFSLYGSDNTLLKTTWDHNYASIVDYTLPSSGTYTIYCEDAWASNVGRYKLKLLCRNEIQANGTPISYGDLISDTLAAFADINAYRFEGQAGDVVIIRMAEKTSAMEPRLSLYGPDNVLIKSTWANTYASIVDDTLPSSGTYTIYCEDEGANDEGEYQLSLQTPIPLTIGEPLENQQLTWNGDARWYSVQVEAGKDLSVFLDKTTDWHSSLSIKYGSLPGGSPDASISGYGDMEVETLNAQAGYYYIEVKKTSSGIDTYTITANLLAVPPSNLTAAAISSTQINLSWQDNSEGEDGFKIERKTEVGDWEEIAMVGTNVITYSDSGLTPNTIYYYRVRAYNSVGNSDYSNVVVLPEAQVVYSNDFERVVGSEWSNTKTDITPSGRRFLGQFGNGTVSLGLDELPSHMKVKVSFDLFILKSWDGRYHGYGPDIWDLSVDGSSTLLHTTFSVTNDLQTYPDAYPGNDHLRGTGSAEFKTLGYSYYGDSVYHLNFIFPHAESSLTLSFSGSGLQGTGDESWGLDNVIVIIDEENSAPQTPILISPDDNATIQAFPLAFQLSASDQDLDSLKFKIELLQDGQVVHTLDQSKTPNGWLYDSGETATLTLPDTIAIGTYQWRAQAFDGIDWGPVSETRTVTASPLTIGQPLENQQLTWNGDARWYMVQVDSPSPLVVQMDKVDAWDATLRVKKDALVHEQPYWADSGSGNLEVALAAAEPGTYYIWVESNSSSNGQYSILATTDINQARESLILDNEVVHAQISIDRGCVTSLV